MFSRFNLLNSEKQFNSVRTPLQQYKLTKEILFFLAYFLFFVLLFSNVMQSKNSEGLMFFGSIVVNMHDIALIFTMSISSLVLLSFIFKYLVIRFNLNSDITYGHVLAKESLDVFDMPLVYVEYSLSYKDDSFFAGEDDHIDVLEGELYAEDIEFLTHKSLLDFNDRFHNIKNYKCQRKEINLSYRELLENFENYNLEKIITKEALEELAQQNSIADSKEFSIELNYILNYGGDRKDVVILNEQLIDNFKFDSQTFFTILISLGLVLLAFYDEIFINSEQDFFVLLSKSIQYNLFFYLLLFLTHKKYLFR